MDRFTASGTIPPAPPGSSAFDGRSHKKRADAAWGRHDEWTKILWDAYRFVTPHRQSTRLSTWPGARMDFIFDSTASTSLMRSAGRLQQDLFPPGEPFGKMEPSPFAKAVASKHGQNLDDVNAECELASTQIGAVFLNGEWDGANIEMLEDLLVSTGFLLILEGDEDTIARFVSASQDEVALDAGPLNEIGGIFFRRKWPMRAILQQFPRGNFTEAFRLKAEADGETEKELAQDVVYDARARRWRLYAYIWDDPEHLIWEEESKTCPWITPRYYRLPGQVYGWGPAMMSMATTKTLNKAVELTLRTAALNMAGIFTRVDDGVFNPDTARIEPGAFWTVARNGGPTGPSIQRLPPGGDPQLSNLVLQDLRAQVHLNMNDQQLPPTTGQARAAAEIIERVRRGVQDHAGAFGRLCHECVVPAWKRVEEILEKKGILQTNLRAGTLLTKLRVVSPLGAMFEATQAANYMQWAQAAEAIGGPGSIHMISPVNSALSEIGRALGLPARWVHSESVQQDIQASIADGVKQAVAAMQKQQQQPAAPNGDPAQAMQGGQ